MKNNLTLNEIDNNFPLSWLKKIITLSFRLLGAILDNFNKKNFDFKLDNKRKSFFFGYHDKKPFNYNNTKIIFHSFSNTKILENQSKKKVFINLIDLNKKKILNLDSTTAWSWQLGANLQWHPEKDIIFFNKKIKKNYITREININSNVRKNHNFSIYNISPNRNNYLIADFVKIGKLRKGYGFQVNTVQKFSSLRKCKLEIVNEKNKKKILYLFDETKNKSIIGCYINHQTFSPKQTKIAYFYTILKKNNQRQIHFYYYCLKKKKNFLINVSKSNLISHYCWKNEDEILFTMKIKNKQYSYVLYNIKKNKSKILSSILNNDGHPMFNPKNKDLFVSDTYPNLLGFQKLFIFSLNKKKILWKKFIYSPYKFKGVIRCDLHPRWSNDGKKILIDFIDNGNRNIGIFKI